MTLVPEELRRPLPRSEAPWTDAQVENLRSWQAAPHLHAFTCPGHEHAVDGSCPTRDLTPTPDGWTCACGAYRQSWAHAAMVDGPPPPDPFAHLRNRNAES